MTDHPPQPANPYSFVILPLAPAPLLAPQWQTATDYIRTVCLLTLWLSSNAEDTIQ